jgi:hypothetical protein
LWLAAKASCGPPRFDRIAAASHAARGDERARVFGFATPARRRHRAHPRAQERSLRRDRARDPSPIRLFAAGATVNCAGGDRDAPFDSGVIRSYLSF